MLKRVLILFVCALAPVLVVAALIVGAQSLSIPVPKDNYEQCFRAAQQTGNKHPDCRLYDTIWERGLIDPTAYYTMWLTFFTGVLTIVGIGGVGLAYGQIKLARDEFNATHRPKIILQRIERAQCGGADGAPPTLATIDLVFANAGETVGDVLGWHAMLYFRDKNVGFYPFPLKTVTPSNRTFSLGPGETMFATATHESVAEAFRSFLDNPTNWEMYVVGSVSYIGRDGIKRSSGFCRQWNIASGNWRPTQDSQYEYAY